MRWTIERPFVLSACLLAVLFFDGTGILHCCVGAMLLHESGHLLAYRLLLHQTPVLRLRLGGAALQWAALRAAPWQEGCILAAGPLANLLAAGGCALAVRYAARYLVYFFGGANLLLAAFNLLPMGFLDGGRLLELLLARILPPRAVWAVCGAAQWLCLAALAALLTVCGVGWATRLALLCFLGYYCARSFFTRG